MKKLLLGFAFLILCNCANAEKFQDAQVYGWDKTKKEFTPQNFPVLYKYCDDYAKQLYYKFDPKIYPHPGYCQVDAYYLKKDGQIVFLNNDPSILDKESKKFRQFILDNAPAPFPKGIEDKVIPIAVDICVLKASRDNKFRIYTFDNVGFKRKTTLNISADKSIKYKNMTPKKCKRLGLKWDSEGGYCITPYRNE